MSMHQEKFNGNSKEVFGMKVMVLGAGTMGAGIVQVAAQAGFDVVVRDIKQEFVDKGIKGIDKGLEKMVSKGRMEAGQKDAIMGKISGTVDLAEAKDCDIVIEAAVEIMDIKKAIFKELDAICTLSLHDALPIYLGKQYFGSQCYRDRCCYRQS